MPAIDASKYTAVKIEKRNDGVATLVLNNPAKKNALSRTMHRELSTLR